MCVRDLTHGQDVDLVLLVRDLRDTGVRRLVGLGDRSGTVTGLLHGCGAYGW